MTDLDGFPSFRCITCHVFQRLNVTRTPLETVHSQSVDYFIAGNTAGAVGPRPPDNTWPWSAGSGPSCLRTTCRPSKGEAPFQPSAHRAQALLSPALD